MVKDQHPQSVKEATASLLPVWLEAFKVLLNHDAQRDVANNDNWDGLAIRIQIFKVHLFSLETNNALIGGQFQTLDTIHTSFPRALTPYLKDFLAASLQHLQSLFPTFTEFYLTSSASPPGSSEDEFIGLPHLICPIIDFMSSATRGGRAKEWFDSGNLQALVHSLFRYVQMTEEDVRPSLRRRFPDFQLIVVSGRNVGCQCQCFRCARGRRDSSVQCPRCWLRSAGCKFHPLQCIYD